MPIGSYAAVPLLTETLLRYQPDSVLDLGMGFGGNGVVVREWLDLGVRPWKTFLAGVEVWSEYRNPVWDLYNAVYVQTIEQYLTTQQQQSFDAILLNDVLEHFEKDAGRRLLEHIKHSVRPGGCFIVTTPADFMVQSAVYGNPWEQHRCLWSASELTQLGFTVKRLPSAHLPCLFAHCQA